MDYNELVRGVVLQVLSQLEGLPTASDSQGAKPKFFVVSPKHGEHCHHFLENGAMKERFDMTCAMSQGFSCKLEGCGGLAVFGLGNADLARLSSGICDTPFTELISKALIMGLPVFVVREEIEILSCGFKTPYAKMYLDKLKTLESMGLTLCGLSELEKLALAGAKADSPGLIGGCVTCSGRVITERDVLKARAGGAKVIKTASRPIITDLAKECAKKNGIEFSAQ